MAAEGGTFVSVTGGTFETAMPGTFVSAAGGTFETVMSGTFHSATGGTFETVLGGTIKPLPSKTAKSRELCCCKIIFLAYFNPNKAKYLIEIFTFCYFILEIEQKSAIFAANMF